MRLFAAEEARLFTGEYVLFPLRFRPLGLILFL
jgi:hypothetical protein